ncbi:MAG: nitrile hydratase accessory protein [Solirubrobacteraceae bacterium MAG38_C4-C5]|nr:nitrile hydratase accessory protein [Candidatus Siliceabacter maunaloa]
MIVEDLEGPLALPRTNGELLFAQPWEASALALAQALEEQGLLDREAFRRRLVAEIGAWGHAPRGEQPTSDYYVCWLRALEDAVLAEGLAGADELRARTAELDEHDQH